MPIPKFLTNIIGGKASDIVTSLGGVVDKFVQTKEEKDAANLAIQEAVNKHLEAMEVEATKQLEAEYAAITERWKADMESDSWLAKNTRPLVMLSLLGFLFLLITFDSLNIKFEVKDSYITLMETLLITVVVAYFGSRGVEKFQTIRNSKQKK